MVNYIFPCRDHSLVAFQKSAAAQKARSVGISRSIVQLQILQTLVTEKLPDNLVNNVLNQKNIIF